MSIGEKLLSAVRAAHSRANAIAEESKHIQLPENPAAWISDIESFAASLPDEIPQKEKILRYSQFASAAIRDNNEPELRCHVLSISRLCEDADLNSVLMSETARLRPLIVINAARANMQERAQEMARDLWANDTEREFRLSEVCNLVRDELIRLNPEHEIPKDLRPWLRPIAPDYAQKAGRPKK